MAHKEKAHSLPAANCQLPTAALRRYARHIVLPEIGEAGQRKLLASSVLVIGAGGLGSAALSYLAASGVGRLGIVEPDRVELSNLQRQVLYEEADIGRAKADASRDRIHEINPGVAVELFKERLTAENARSLIKDFFSLPRRGRVGVGVSTGDVKDIPHGAPLPSSPLMGEGIIIDGSDNFATRFAVAEAAAREKKPLISAAIVGFEGQISAFKPYEKDQPCYRCFVPEAPERERSCAQEGIVGPLAGMMGSMQALEAVRFITGIGSLSGTLLTFDARSMQMKSLKLTRDPACPHCKNTR